MKQKINHAYRALLNKKSAKNMGFWYFCCDQDKLFNEKGRSKNLVGLSLQMKTDFYSNTFVNIFKNFSSIPNVAW
jgi:hypothetical protein